MNPSVHWARIAALAVPGAAILALIAFFILARPHHRKSLVITAAIMILFSGDTAKKILAFYQYLFHTGNPVAVADVSFPLTNLLLSVAIGILLYFFVVYVAGKFRSIPEDARDNAPTALLNTLVISVLGLSFFVVISVFITIPYLSEISKPSIYTQQMLDSTLDKIADQPLEFTLPPRETPPFLAADTLPHRRISPAMNKYVDAEVIQVNALMARRANAVNNLIGFASAYKQNEAFAMQKLSRDFASASQDIRRNKPELFGKAVDAFVLFRKRAVDGYSQALSMLRTADVVDSAEVNMFFKNMAPEPGNPQVVRDSVIRHLRLISFTPYPDTIAFQSELPSIQPSNHDGSEWGIFGLMSQYLINTESSELVLLMGMLGFGLLGASLSSFEAAERDRNIFETFRSKPLVKNFGYVLARGCGAAIAVYLCTKAGLAIFTMGSATSSDNASSYMLLLTCFVASIYSDRVWTMLSDSLAPVTREPAPDVSAPQGGSQPSTDAVPPAPRSPAPGTGEEDADAGAALPGTSPSLDHDDAELSFEKGVQSDTH
jgi:hypothetical protein